MFSASEPAVLVINSISTFGQVINRETKSKILAINRVRVWKVGREQLLTLQELSSDPEGQWSNWFRIIISIIASYQLQNMSFEYFCRAFKKERQPFLLCWFTSWKKIDWLIVKKVHDSLIDEEASWLKYEEELNEKKPLWIVNSATADALVARDIAALGVSDQLAAISSDWLDTNE